MMPQNSLPAPPCPRALAAMDTDELLYLMETHGDERHTDQELVQRLGIHCESYLALMLAGTSPREWRGLAGMATTR